MADYISSYTGPQIDALLGKADSLAISSPSDGQVLKYSSSTQKFENANEKTELPALTGSAGKILAVNSGATGVEWVTPSGGGGLTDYDFTHTQIFGTPNSVTFAAGERCSVFAYVNIDTSMSIACENNSDNYIWICNSGSSDVDITISDITQNSISVSNVYMPEDGITVPSGKVCEIGIIVNSNGAFITCRNDIVLSSSI